MSKRFTTIVLFVIMAVIGTAATPAIAAVRIFRLDAVELVKNGKEVEGDKKHTAVRDGYTYHFASAQTKAAFEADPTRYEIQMGGACARMGPLSGGGNPSLFAIHDERLYLFASKQCRSAFLAAPAKFIEKDEPPVKADAAAMKRGLELLEKTVKAHGGASAIDAVKTYRQVRETEVTQAGAKYDYKYTTTIAYPDRIHDEFCWNDNCSWQTIDGSRGADWTGSGYDRPLAASQIRAVKRKANENLVSILKARRSRPDFIVAHRVVMQQPGGTEVILVSYDGLTRELEIDSKSGLVKWLRYTGRGGKRDEIDEIVVEFVDYKTIEGVVVPVSWKSGSYSDGKDTLIKLTTVEINSKIDDKLFAVDPPK